jgi:hypothetical protein
MATATEKRARFSTALFLAEMKIVSKLLSQCAIPQIQRHRSELRYD